MERKILIIGGGFGGIITALELAKKKSADVKITLISDKPHFEYHASLYRVITNHSPLEVCIPIIDVLQEKEIDFFQDTITEVNLKNKEAVGKSTAHYAYDYLILALGSETEFYHIPGLKEHAFTVNSMKEVIRLKKHIYDSFAQCSLHHVDRKCNTHIVIVGGGATGCETAGAIVLYAKKLAKEFGISRNTIRIDLIHSGERLMPMAPTHMSQQIEHRLKALGVRVMLHKRLLHEEIEEVYLQGMKMKTKTVVWTAGVKPNSLYKKIAGLDLDEKGKVLVDEYLQACGQEEVFVIGDGAATQYSGMAQTAEGDGTFVADNITRILRGENPRIYTPKKPSLALPIGEGWAAVAVHFWQFYGTIGWVIRKLIDLAFFLSILPMSKAWLVFQSNKQLAKSCPICADENKRSTTT